MTEALAASIEGGQELESTTVWINRTSATVKGGRRMSFSALVVVGDRRGKVGIGYAGAPGVPAAIEKAQKDARKHLYKVVLQEGTFPHPVEAKFSSSIVRLVPAAPGTGVVAGGTVRAVLEMAGVRDALTKVYGSTSKINLVKATLEALKQMRSKDQVAGLRTVEIAASSVEEMLEKGRRYAPQVQIDSDRPKGPVSKVPGRSSRGGRGRRGRSDDRGGDRGPAHAPQAQAPVPASAAPAPAPQQDGSQESKA